jgi:hypothetical protein
VLAKSSPVHSSAPPRPRRPRRRSSHRSSGQPGACLAEPGIGVERCAGVSLVEGHGLDEVLLQGPGAIQQGQRGPPTRQASGTVGIPEPFRPPVIHSARLDLREYGVSDAGPVRGLLAAGAEPEALPPAAPPDPGEAAGPTRRRRAPAATEGTGVRLMMLDRATGRIVGSISCSTRTGRSGRRRSATASAQTNATRGTRPRHSAQSRDGRSPKAASSGPGCRRIRTTWHRYG